MESLENQDPETLAKDEIYVEQAFDIFIELVEGHGRNIREDLDTLITDMKLDQPRGLEDIKEVKERVHGRMRKVMNKRNIPLR